ncbi:hypothetical protein ACFQU7_27745 [Pseudoroseomonas wenyumeiae]
MDRKRVLGLMRRASLILQPITARRAIRAHESTVVAPASNQRWASHGSAICCWNGEPVHAAFAIDIHDREIIGERPPRPTLWAIIDDRQNGDAAEPEREASQHAQ